MEVYSVKKGKFYFNGDKIQPIFFQYILTFILIFFSIRLHGWIELIAAIAFYVYITLFIKKETKMDSMRVYFLPNCTYQLSTNYDQVNKLFGFSEGYHHWNSARIGWRCTDGEKIELLAYAYINGQRIIKPMITCRPETWVFCNIQNQPSKYIFKALDPSGNNITVSIDKPKKISIYSFFKLFIYRLFPYFGGSISAPHDMKLYLLKLK